MVTGQGESYVRSRAKVLSAFAVLSAFLILGVTVAAATAPTVSVDNATSVSYTSAHVSGKVNPEDTDTYYYFQYSADPDTEGWSTGAFQGPLAANSGEATVSDDLVDLKPGTQYFLRLVAANFVDAEVFSPEPNPSFTTDPVALPTVTISAPTALTGTTAHFAGTIDPEAPGGNPAAFDVAWSFECTPACPGLSGTIPADSASHAVSADATGLEPNTDYEVSLVAKNAGAPATAGPEAFKTAQLVPEVFSASVFNPKTTTATITALANPHNSTVSDCHFAYGTTAAYGQTIPCTSTPSGNSAVRVSADLTGLSPDTGYHFRLFLTTSGGSTEGEDHGFSTFRVPAPAGACPNAGIRALQGTENLPECRAFEQVTPVEKNGGNVSFSRPAQSALAPGAIAYSLSSGLPGQETNQAIGWYRAKRAATGWSSRSFDLPQTNPGSSIIETTKWISPDLSKSVSASNLALAPGATEGGTGVYVHKVDTGELDLVAEESDPPVTDGVLYSAFMSVGPGPVWGATDDLSHVVFETRADLGQGAAPGTNNVWEWADGHLRLVNRLPNGDPSPNGAFAKGQRTALQFPNVISTDGSRVFFSANLTSVGGTAALYVRENGTTTTLVSRSHRAGDDPTKPLEAAFVGASDNGRFVFFLSNTPLIEDPRGGMYRVDLDTDTIMLIAPGANDAGTATQRISDDGERIYFTSDKQLTPDAEPGSGLYLWDHGVLKLVVNFADVPSGSLASAMSDDGRYMEFSTAAPVTGFDSTSAACLDSGGNPGRCAEMYSYDAVTGATSCMSCAPAGPSGGDATTGLINGFQSFALYAPTAVLADGTYIFDTPTALVPEDVNRKRDVYESKNGVVELLTTGTDRNDAYYLDTSSDKTDIYFATTGRLVAQDIDTLRDIYSARRGGGLSNQNEILTPARECALDPCQGPQQSPGQAPAIGSATLNGSGNARPHRQHKAKKKGAHKKRGAHKKKGAKKKGAKKLKAPGSTSKGGR